MIMKDYWNEGPKGGYHRQCYQEYKDINKVSKVEQNQRREEDSDGQSSGIEPPLKRVCRSQLQTFDIDKCIVCQKDKVKRAYGKGARTREPLTLNISEFGSTTLIKAARIRNDSRMLLHIDGQDTIAIEIKYHRSCYKNYVNPNQLAKLEEENCQREDDESEGYNRAFDKIKEFVEKEVFTATKAIPISVLAEKYTSFLEEEGVHVVTYRSAKLKNRLTRYFKERLSFHRPLNQNQSEIVYGSHITKGEVVETVFMSTTSIDEEKLANSDSEANLTNTQEEISRQVYHTAKTIRKLVVNMKSTMPWPPSSEDLENESAIVPDLLYNLMAWILSTQSEYSVERVSNISPDVNRLALSLSQDLIHSVSRGRIKTPKHIVLPMTVKNLTGNVELITILNRFGHGLSYSQVEEVETALAEMQIAKQQNGVLVPSVCYPNVPAVFCWDNNDLQEETLSGKVLVETDI
ncbi:uncharacterized protein LOC122949420 [Acropora millepora]|uniref:uncharacterized protein LOC122949420 n=1 Tax=Acropora millepora TaxID=45264 RepID=UPI001CF3178C|nr:uncharacterized protein LOC122949420 [Acropora millepora]